MSSYFLSHLLMTEIEGLIIQNDFLANNPFLSLIVIGTWKVYLFCTLIWRITSLNLLGKNYAMKFKG